MNGHPAQRTTAILVPIVLIVATLYFAREFFMPLALSILISFLLAPIVRGFEKWHFGRIGSVVTAAILAFAILGAVAMVVGGQLIDLANELPGYKTNLREKISAFRTPKGGAIANVTETLKDVTEQLNEEPAADPSKKEGASTAEVSIGPEAKSPASALSTTPLPEPKAGGTEAKTTPPRLDATRPLNPGADLGNAAKGQDGGKPEKPVPVTLVTSRNAFETLRDLAEPILAPLGTAAIVIVFVIFMLLGREDLRDRLIHLIGRGHLQTTTQALDEAGHRVSRYLLAQLLVNSLYGVPVAIGLYFIGIPNAILWGLLATLLRFIPYIGAWIASGFPLALSVAVGHGWTMTAQTVALFVVVELITNNVLEPWLYGASTGMSALAVIVAAAFWTWLWGMTGLLLATPLTVCIAVLGKYIPALAFVDVLLGDKPPIAAEDRFYQRLLASDEDEGTEIVEKHVAAHGVAETYDKLIIPAIRLADEDYHRQNLNDERRKELMEQVSLIVNDIGEPKVARTGDAAVAAGGTAEDDPTLAAVVIPACDYADEIAGMMLTKLVAAGGATCRLIPSKLLASEMMEEIAKLRVREFCISVTPPGASRHAVYMSKRLRDRFPEARILIGVWGEPDNSDRIQRYRKGQVDGVFNSLQAMTREVLATAAVIAPVPAPAPEPTRAEAKAEARTAAAAAKVEAAAVKAEAAAAKLEAAADAEAQPR